jgi:hypothetical protein
MKISLSKCIGITAVLVGTICFWEAFTHAVIEPLVKNDATPYLAALGVVLFTPLWLVVFFGFKVFAEPNKNNICWAVGSLFVIAIAYGATRISDLFRVWITDYDTVVFSLAVLAVTCVALPVYVWISKTAMRGEGLVIEGLQDFFGKAFVVVFAVLVWNAVDDLFNFFEPTVSVINPLNPFESASMCVPPLVAWATYKIFGAIVGLEPRGVEHFFNKGFVLALATFVWIFSCGYLNPNFPRSTDNGPMPYLISSLAAGGVYVGLRFVAWLGSKFSKPVSPIHA